MSLPSEWKEPATNGYQKRESHFAHRFVRLLTKTALATELGPEVCWLLTVIAHTEDARHYKGPVTFWNEQLAPLCGFASVGRLIRARTKAIESGWLGYQAGAKGRAGRYWVTIPSDVARIPDGAADDTESIHSVYPSKIEGQTEGIRRANGSQTEFKRKPSYPIPNPNPPPPPAPQPATKANRPKGEGEGELICRAKAIGLADVDAVRIAIERGWNASTMGRLFDEFERRRPTWNGEITSPCGLLAHWLRTLEPDATVPWPESVKPLKVTREADPADRQREFLERLVYDCFKGRDSGEGERLYLERAKAAGISEIDAQSILWTKGP